MQKDHHHHELPASMKTVVLVANKEDDMKSFGPGDPETYPCWVRDPTSEAVDYQALLENRRDEIMEEIVEYSTNGFDLFDCAVKEARNHLSGIQFLLDLQSLIRAGDCSGGVTLEMLDNLLKSAKLYFHDFAEKEARMEEEV